MQTRVLLTLEEQPITEERVDSSLMGDDLESLLNARTAPVCASTPKCTTSGRDPIRQTDGRPRGSSV